MLGVACGHNSDRLCCVLTCCRWSLLKVSSGHHGLSRMHLTSSVSPLQHCSSATYKPSHKSRPKRTQQSFSRCRWSCCLALGSINQLNRTQISITGWLASASFANSHERSVKYCSVTSRSRGSAIGEGLRVSGTLDWRLSKWPRSEKAVQKELGRLWRKVFVKEMSFKSRVKGRWSDRWWERRWWLWWGDVRRMKWTRRRVNRMRLTERRRKLIPQVRWCI